MLKRGNGESPNYAGTFLSKTPTFDLVSVAIALTVQILMGVTLGIGALPCIFLSRCKYADVVIWQHMFVYEIHSATTQCTYIYT